MLGARMPSAVVLLSLLFEFATPMVQTPYATPARMPRTHVQTMPRKHAQTVTMALYDDEEEEYDGEEPLPDAPDEDWNLAWNRFSLEYVAAAYEVEYEEYYPPQRNAGVDAFAGGVVACLFVAAVLHAYIMSTGGIVIAPGNETPFSLYNFEEVSAAHRTGHRGACCSLSLSLPLLHAALMVSASLGAGAAPPHADVAPVRAQHPG